MLTDRLAREYDIDAMKRLLRPTPLWPLGPTPSVRWLRMEGLLGR